MVSTESSIHPGLFLRGSPSPRVGQDSIKYYVSAPFGQPEPIFLAVACLKLLAAAGQMFPCGMKGTADAESPQEGTGTGVTW